MVNYCCVYGCGRNSKSNVNLSFYSLPNEISRQVEWLKAGGREDLLEHVANSELESKSFQKLKSCRFCSRHFNPSTVKNKSRHLSPDAVPTLNLPGQWHEEKSDDEHTDIACNKCEQPVVGFRYKCVTCPDFDLCHKCETLQMHRQHFMLRIPKPIKFKLADQLIQKWRKFFKCEHATPDAVDDSSDDDQPITKYAKNYDSGIDLSEDVKEKIRKEVRRVASLKLDQKKKQKKPAKLQKKKEDRKRQSTVEETERVIMPSKRMKTEEGGRNSSFTANSAPEVAFADVNDIKDLKPERIDYPNMMPATSSVCASGLPSVPTTPLSIPSSVPAPPALELQGQLFHEDSTPAPGPEQQPVMHVKLSDDLTELMIEVTRNNEKTFYKYPDCNS